MKQLSKALIIKLHEQMLSQTGGTPGIRDEGLLESAMAAPFQEFSGVQAFPTLQQKAARLGYGIVMNHPFVDGNKRTGAHVLLVLLAVNGIELDYTQKELADIILQTAAGVSGYDELLEWILNHEM